MLFFEHLICMIKQGADILAGCIVLRGPAPDVCIKNILNFGHCMTMRTMYSETLWHIISKPGNPKGVNK